MVISDFPSVTNLLNFRATILNQSYRGTFEIRLSHLSGFNLKSFQI